MATKRLPVSGRRMFTRWQATLLVGVWLVFLIQPLVEGLREVSRPVGVATVVATLGFAVVYLTTITRGFQQAREDPMRSPNIVRGLTVIAILVVLGLVTVPALHAASLVFTVYISAAAIAFLPLRIAMGVVLAAVLTSVTTYALRPDDRSNVSGTLLGLVLAVTAMLLGMRARERSLQLDLARAQMTDLAVAAERERMSRDLHDILGHSLTVIVMKAELARRLAPGQPERVRAEVTDIERLARSALADVRATISGSKQVTLSRELVHARSALVAAGIEPHLPGSVDDVPDGASALFGWVLREGVTNVIRHSAATNCWVEVTERSIQVVDDGTGPYGTGRGGGQGLSGLRARVDEAGGTLSVSATVGGGFKVRADLPVDWHPDDPAPADFDPRDPGESHPATTHPALDQPEAGPTVSAEPRRPVGDASPR
jgi:two-component system, NarL family, sensor histidine kinase DesK